jgi:hypothetical protein
MVRSTLGGGWQDIHGIHAPVPWTDRARIRYSAAVLLVVVSAKPLSNFPLIVHLTHLLRLWHRFRYICLISSKVLQFSAQLFLFQALILLDYLHGLQLASLPPRSRDL